MAKSTIFSSMDLMDGLVGSIRSLEQLGHPINSIEHPKRYALRVAGDYTRIKQHPCYINRSVTNLLRPVRDFAPSYFDNELVHSRAIDGQTNVEVHRLHVRKVLTLMREHKLYANLKKLYLLLEKYHFLVASWVNMAYGPTQKEFKAITDWPLPTDIKGIRKFLGLAAYLHKYSHNITPR